MNSATGLVVVIGVYHPFGSRRGWRDELRYWLGGRGGVWVAGVVRVWCALVAWWVWWDGAVCSVVVVPEWWWW